MEGAKTCDKLEEVTERTNGWFVGFIEKINSMIEVGDCTEDIEAVIVEEEAKLQVVLKESKEEVTESISTGVVIGSIAFYEKLQWSINSQVGDIKKTIKESTQDNSKVVQKIDIEAAKVEFKKTTEVELVNAKVEIFEEEKKQTIVSEVEDKDQTEIIVSKDKITCKFEFFFYLKFLKLIYFFLNYSGRFQDLRTLRRCYQAYLWLVCRFR